MKYQRDYAQHFPATTDIANRRRKAVKVSRSLLTFLRRADLEGLVCLDFGCSIGVISHHLAEAGAMVVALDLDLAAVQQAARVHSGAQFLTGDVSAAPFPAETFDLLICSQVYEHSPSVPMLIHEIERLLKPGGICFFSGPNRFALVEDHYDIPFLSWLPQAWADTVVRWTGRGSEYYEHPLSAGELRRLLSRFAIHDLTSELLRHPAEYAMESEVGAFRHVARWVPAWGWPILSRCVPNFNWILKKP